MFNRVMGWLWNKMKVLWTNSTGVDEKWRGLDGIVHASYFALSFKHF